MKVNQKVKIVIKGNQSPLYGKIHEVIHETGPAWPALFKINVGTDDNPELRLYYEFDDDYKWIC